MTEQVMGRSVRLVLVNRSGVVHGQTAPFSVRVPWLQEVAEIVDTVQQQYNIRVIIIRLMEVVEQTPVNLVTYLAEIPEDVDVSQLPLKPADTELPTAEKRMNYAEVGGPAADLDWVAEVLSARGEQVHDAAQIRTWNLSSIWRIDAAEKIYWLKSIPSFFSHEAKVIELLAQDSVPRLVGYEGTRLLMEHIPGEDLYDANLDQMKKMISSLVNLQCQQTGREAELLALGLQDWRSSSMAAKLIDVVNRHLDAFSTEQKAALTSLTESIPARLRVLADSGLPNTIVHGDFHPGNWRGLDDTATILDWGDCFVGHPLLDFPGLLDRVDRSLRPTLKDYWVEEWQAQYPGAKLEQVSDVIEPLAALRMAWVYQMFLDEIEPSEHVYHRDDPVASIQRAIELCAEG